MVAEFYTALFLDSRITELTQSPIDTPGGVITVPLYSWRLLFHRDERRAGTWRDFDIH